jgi:hypothetical protein
LTISDYQDSGSEQMTKSPDGDVLQHFISLPLGLLPSSIHHFPSRLVACDLRMAGYGPDYSVGMD